jgi:pyruvate dehydrogenase E1 component alpha subunit
MYHARLLSLGVAEDRLEAIQEEVAEAIDSATHVAMTGAEPGEASLMTQVYADGGSRWRN